MWRTLLVGWPARLTEIGYAFYRLYLLVILLLAGPGLLLLVLTITVLWYGFGIRWGW